MDEPRNIDDREIEEPQAPAEVEDSPKPKLPAAPEVAFEGIATGKEPWKKGSGCSQRLPLYGCIFGVVVLIGILFAGTSMMRKTVWVNMERGRRAVINSLPRDLPPAERERTIQNLNRFKKVLEASKDPYPTMGEFMNKTRTAFSDGRFTHEEIEEINLYLEQIIKDSGLTPMQLGANSIEAIGSTEWQQMMCRRVLQGPPRSRCTVLGELGSTNGTLAGRKRPAYKNACRKSEWATVQIPSSEFV